jgi:hypothetical protein
MQQGGPLAVTPHGDRVNHMIDDGGGCVSWVWYTKKPYQWQLFYSTTGGPPWNGLAKFVLPPVQQICGLTPGTYYSVLGLNVHFDETNPLLPGVLLTS